MTVRQLRTYSTTVYIEPFATPIVHINVVVVTRIFTFMNRGRVIVDSGIGSIIGSARQGTSGCLNRWNRLPNLMSPS